MSSLIVLGFDGIHTADEVLNKARSLQKQNLIDLEDACVVERQSDGKREIGQARMLTREAPGGFAVPCQIEDWKCVVHDLS